MKLKHIEEYTKYYCCLCSELKTRFGAGSRLLLSYDTTFLFCFLDGLLAQERPRYGYRCPLWPFKSGGDLLSADALRYAALMNYWLFLEKCRDDSADRHSPMKALVAKRMDAARRYQNELRAVGVDLHTLHEKLETVYRLESDSGEYLFDRATNAFGMFLSEIFCVYLEARVPSEKELADNVRGFAFYLGKWIYIMDALDDYADDKKKNRFNLLDKLHFESNTPQQEELCARIVSLHLLITEKIQQYYKRLTWHKNEDIIYNVVFYGMHHTVNKILKNRFPDCYDRLKEGVPFADI